MTAALVPMAVGGALKSVADVIDTALKADAQIQAAREQTKQCEVQARVMCEQIASQERQRADELSTHRHDVDRIAALGLAGVISADQVVTLMLARFDRER